MSEWIPVTKRLPEPGQVVSVYDAWKTGLKNQVTAQEEGFDLRFVTHWSPDPKAVGSPDPMEVSNICSTLCEMKREGEKYSR